MSTAEHGSSPADLERKAKATRGEVDRTLDAIENRFSIKRRMSAATQAVGAAANRASRLASPEITTMIRMDHTHVLAAFHRYRSRASAAHKQAVVANACLGLEIHTQLEEEIFYPALFPQGGEELAKSVSEHNEMRALMQRMRQITPRDAEYDETFFSLMRIVIHHVADEESTLLPLAEWRLKGQLRELGWRMTVRRFELLRPHTVELASSTARTFPVLTGTVAAGIVTGLAAVVWLFVRPRDRASQARQLVRDLRA